MSGSSSNFNDFMAWEASTQDTIDFKKIYVDMAGDLVSGLVLSVIVYWHLPSKKDHKDKMRVFHDNETWIASTYGDWWDRCRITPKQAQRAIDILVSKQIVLKHIYKFDGVPTVHIRIDKEKFVNLHNVMLEKYFENAHKGKPICPTSQMENDLSGVSLTETTTETTTEILSGETPEPSYEPLAKPHQKKNDKTKYFSLANAISEVTGISLKANQGAMFREAKLLSSDPTANPERVLQDYGPGGLWYQNDWRGKKGQKPGICDVRSTWGSLQPVDLSSQRVVLPIPTKEKNPWEQYTPEIWEFRIQRRKEFETREDTLDAQDKLWLKSQRKLEEAKDQYENKI
jgi:hypothetical protein